MNGKSKQIINKTLNYFIALLVLFLVVISSVLGYVKGVNKYQVSKKEREAIKKLQTLPGVYDAIKNHYVTDKVDWSKIDYSRSLGMLYGLDPYSRIVPRMPALPSGIIDLPTNQKKIGIIITQNAFHQTFIDKFFNKEKLDSSTIYLSSAALPDLPDSEKKLKRGDRIFSFTDIETSKIYRVEGLSNVDLMATLNRSEFRDALILTVIRLISNVETELKFRVDKQVYADDEINKNENGLKLINPETALIKLPTFADSNEYQHFRNNIKKIVTKEDNGEPKLDLKNVKNVILDLRGNGGGDLKILQQVVKLLLGNLNNKDFLELKNERSESSTKYVSAVTQLVGMDVGNLVSPDEALLPNRPNIRLVALIDENSASATEALIGILENDEFTGGRFLGTVGKKTFGKGVSQSRFPLDGTNYDLILTTRYFYMKDNTGKWVNHDKNGFEPIINIEKTYESELVHENEADDMIIKKAITLFS